MTNHATSRSSRAKLFPFLLLDRNTSDVGGDPRGFSRREGREAVYAARTALLSRSRAVVQDYLGRREPDRARLRASVKSGSSGIGTQAFENVE
jgi:hypothetical protein